MKLFAKYFESAVSPAFYCLALWSCVLLSQFMIGKQSEFYRILKNVIVKLDKWSKSIQHSGSGCNIIPSKSNILSLKLFLYVTHTYDTLCHSLCHLTLLVSGWRHSLMSPALLQQVMSAALLLASPGLATDTELWVPATGARTWSRPRLLALLPGLQTLLCTCGELITYSKASSKIQNLMKKVKYNHCYHWWQSLELKCEACHCSPALFLPGLVLLRAWPCWVEPWHTMTHCHHWQLAATAHSATCHMLHPSVSIFNSSHLKNYRSRQKKMFLYHI